VGNDVVERSSSLGKFAGSLYRIPVEQYRVDPNVIVRLNTRILGFWGTTTRPPLP